MKKEVMRKLADLSTYLDKKGHRDQAHEVDHMLRTVAEVPSLHELLGIKPREKPGMGGQYYDEMVEGKPPANQPAEPEGPQVGPSKPEEQPKEKIVVIELEGFEPLRIKYLEQLQRIAQDPRVDKRALAHGIYESILGPGWGSKMQDKSLEEAVADAQKMGYLKEKAWYEKLKFWD